MKTSVQTDDESVSLLKSKHTDNLPKHRGYGARHTFVILSFCGYFHEYALRFSMSIAIVAMTNSTDGQSNANDSTGECPDHNIDRNSSSTKTKTGEFPWDEALQGLVLSSFFYGYIITQIPAGSIAEKFGGKRPFGFGILITSVLTLLTPLLAHVGVEALIAIRVVEGLAEGFAFPSMSAMQGKWVPKQERATMPTLIMTGAAFGNVICYPLCGYLCDSDLFGGWPSVFYLFGTTGCIWWIFWHFLVYDTPAQHPRISSAERMYIEMSCGEKKQYTIPWKAILTSPAVWAINVANFSQGWGGIIVLANVPTYMNKVQKYDITQDGLMLAIPNSAAVLFTLVYGALVSLVLKTGLPLLYTRKLFVSIGCIIPAVCFPMLSLAGCDHLIIVGLFTVSSGIAMFISATTTINILDIGHNFSGTIMGIANFWANLSAVVAPYLVGYLTNHKETFHSWRQVFYIAMGSYIVCFVTYVTFGRDNSQPWNNPDHSPNNMSVTITANETESTSEQVPYIREQYRAIEESSQI